MAILSTNLGEYLGEYLRCAEWIDLHSGEYFGTVVEYLRRMLDQQAASLSATDRDAVTTTFVRAIELELAFFDHVYAVQDQL